MSTAYFATAPAGLVAGDLATLTTAINLAGLTIAAFQSSHTPSVDSVVLVTSRAPVPPSEADVTAYLDELSVDARTAMQALMNRLLGRVGG